MVKIVLLHIYVLVYLWCFIMKIFLISGESGSGKTTIVNQLPYNIIKSYTTRSKRDDILDNDHTFIKRMDIGKFYDLVAISYINGEFYFATKEQFKDDEINIYTVDDKGIIDTLNYFKEEEVYTVKIVRDNININKDRMDRKILRYFNDYDYVLINNSSIKDSVDKLIRWIENV